MSAVQRPIAEQRASSAARASSSSAAGDRRSGSNRPSRVASASADDVARLLAGLARGPGAVLAERGDRGGFERAGGGAQPGQRRRARGERDLLLEDDRDERREPGRPVPEGRRAVAGEDPGEVGVAIGEDRRGRPEAGEVERRVRHHGHGNPPGHRPVAPDPRAFMPLSSGPSSLRPNGPVQPREVRRTTT